MRVLGLILTLQLALLALTSVAMAYQGLEYVGSSGYLRVYRAGDDVYYAVVDESFFTGLDGFLLKRYGSEDSWASVRCSSAPWRLVLLEEAGFEAGGCGDVSVRGVLGPEGEVELSRSVEGLLREAGVSYAWATLKLHPETGLVILAIYTPRGEGAEALSLAGEARRVAEGIAGVRVDAVIVVETLWPPAASRDEAEAPFRKLLEAIEEPWRLWRESEGRQGGPAAAIRSVTTDPVLYLTVDVEAPRMERLGVTLEDLLSWLRGAVGPGVTVVVEVHEYEPDIGPGPSGDGGPTWTLVAAGIALATLAVLASVAALKAFRARV